jgi:hypothetical protein
LSEPPQGKERSNVYQPFVGFVGVNISTRHAIL